jgi:phage terminase large subunit-like protein
MTTAATRKPQRYSYGPEVCDWIERNCVLPSGEHIGQPFRLLPWQRDWITEIYETDAEGTRRYRWSLLGVPKGNGKTPLAAALGLYNLLGDPDEADPWIVCAAASDKQADILFAAAKTMCEQSPTLRDRTLRYRWEIQVKDGRGKLERVAASKGKLDGKIVSMLLVDELHEWEQENWVILTGGALKRERSQIIQITTAGYDLETVCGVEYEKGLAIREGKVQNPTYSFRWYGAPANADYRDPKVWKAANPSYGALVHESVLADLAINVHESAFRRYRLNQWVASETTWLPHGAWDRCGLAGVELVAGAGPVFVGWDASTKKDTTALVAIQWQEIEGRKRLVAQGWAWERPRLADGNYDEDWRMPMAEVLAVIRTLTTEHEVTAIAYDPAFITWEAADLEASGLPMIEWNQTNDKKMGEATQALYEVIADGTLAHAGDPLAARHVAAIQAYATRSGGQRLGKNKQRKSIDWAIALLMAVGEMRETEVADSFVAYIPGRN